MSSLPQSFRERLIVLVCAGDIAGICGGDAGDHSLVGAGRSGVQPLQVDLDELEVIEACGRFLHASHENQNEEDERREGENIADAKAARTEGQPCLCAEVRVKRTEIPITMMLR